MRWHSWPAGFDTTNDKYAMYNNKGNLEWAWNNMKEEERASNCQRCGACEASCPQQLPIREKLAEIAEMMK